MELHTTDISTLDPHGALADPRGVGVDATSWDPTWTPRSTTTSARTRDIDYDPGIAVILDLFLTLRRNVPRPLPLVLVHGDFNPANFLYEGGKVTALIDWENARIGDPREDLGWMTTMDILSNTHVMAHPIDEGGFLALLQQAHRVRRHARTRSTTSPCSVPPTSRCPSKRRSSAASTVRAPNSSTCTWPKRPGHDAEPAPPSRLSGGSPVNTSPSIDQMLEGVIISISTDIVPNLVNPKAARQRADDAVDPPGRPPALPVYDQYLAEEHNQMMERAARRRCNDR